MPGTLDFLILEEPFGMEYFHRRGTNNHMVMADRYEQEIINDGPIYAHWYYGYHNFTAATKCHTIGSQLAPVEHINF